MKTYRITSWYNFLNYFLLILATVIIATVASRSLILALAGETSGNRLDLIGWVIVILFAWCMWLWEIKEVAIQDNGMISFRSPIRRATVAISDIELIKSRLIDLNFVLIKHAHGKVRVIRHIDGLADFVYTVKSMNPEVKVRVFTRLANSLHY